MRKRAGFLLFLAGAMACGIAFAADLPTHKEPPPSVAEPFSWTGAYFGALAGYGWADPTGGFSLSSPSLAAAPPIIPVIDAVGSGDLGLRGGLFGAEAGYDWQVSNSGVLGVEGDVEGSSIKGSKVVGGNVPVYGIPYTITQSLRVNWQASLRARAGFAPIDHLLIYATGGLAVADVSYSSAFWDAVNETENKSFSSVRPGVAVGAGVEYAIDAHWSLKAEYLYSQFSAAKGTGSGLLTDGTTAYIAHSTGTLRENAVRLGVNYRFD